MPSRRNAHKQKNVSKTLAGIKVLDFTRILPGPFATMYLGDLGAEVLCVTERANSDAINGERPLIGGDFTIGIGAAAHNKKNIYLNLQHPEAVQAIYRLVATFDVVVEQFYPGVTKRLGLDYNTLKQYNPRLIYCSITGFEQDLSLVDHEGNDISYVAHSGLMGFFGSLEHDSILYIDMDSSSLQAVVGIVSALYHRRAAGIGQYIDISMRNNVISMMAATDAHYLVGYSKPTHKNRPLKYTKVYNFFETSDGGHIGVATLEPKFFNNLCTILNLPKMPEGTEYHERPDHIKGKLREMLKTKTIAAWREIFSKLDDCIEPVLTLSEALDDPQLNACFIFSEVPIAMVEDKVAKYIRRPAKTTEQPINFQHSGCSVDYYTYKVLDSLGYSKRQIKEMI